MELKSPLLLALLACLLSATLRGETKPATSDRHVVVLVWDGMRPDFVTERAAPTLWKLSREGVTFRQHHSVFPTMTNVNGASLATGVYPNRHGLLANREFRPRINAKRAFEHCGPEIIKKGDEISGGKYLAVSTIAETVRRAGRSAVLAGTKSVTFVHDRHATWTSAASPDSYTKFAAAPMPPTLREETLRLLGPFLLEKGKTSDQRNVYATRALTEILWRDGVPAFSLLWLSDPDLTQHDFSPGSEPALEAIRSSDRNLAAVLDALSQKKARGSTDIMVVSDHGFNTIERSIDFPAELRAAGFDAVAAFEKTPQTGQVIVVGNGGTPLFYVVERDRAVTARVVEWLQQSDFAGVIFAREKFDGVFPLESIRLDTPEGPDVMVSLRWNPKPNRFGVPGLMISDASRGPGQGTHATLSKFDVHNTLIAAGPGFLRAMESDLPSGNIDLAPTVLHLLGLKSPQKFDGRVLFEAMPGQSPPPRAATETMEAARNFPSGNWRQQVRLSQVGETVYFDEGNGAFEASPSNSSPRSPASSP